MELQEVIGRVSKEQEERHKKLPGEIIETRKMLTEKAEIIQ
jgi:hypothetical protein